VSVCVGRRVVPRVREASSRPCAIASRTDVMVPVNTFWMCRNRPAKLKLAADLDAPRTTARSGDLASGQDGASRVPFEDIDIRRRRTGLYHTGGEQAPPKGAGLTALRTGRLDAQCERSRKEAGR